MSQEEIIEQLQTENTRLREQNAQVSAEMARVSAENVQVIAENHQLRKQVEELSKQVHELEGRLAKDSHNSSKPPSTDGYAKKRRRSLRESSGKKAGGQAGHQGRTLSLVETPDEIIALRPEKCAHCQASLQGIAASGMERRQVVDLPPISAQVTEYQAHDVRCPCCQQVTRGTFPDAVRASVQYGPMVKGIAVYLLYGQLLPYARTAELLSDVCGCALSPGTLEAFIAEGASRLVETEEQMKQALRSAEVIGTDETGIRVQGVLHWLHTVRTETLTHYAYHRKRGKAATDEIGILPQFHGTMVHDGYSSYPQYTQCEHALCNAHHLRDLRFLHEQEQQQWAGHLKDHLLLCHTTVEEARATGANSLPPEVLGHLTATYHQLILAGLAAQPPPLPMPKHRGRVKQTQAKNLLDRLKRDAPSVLLFMSDFRVPFTNNGAEQDLRMVKVQQKISGTFRSDAGPTAFCRIRGYFSTMAKQGHHLCRVARQLFAEVPLSPIGAV
jgi:transposase